MDKPIELAYKVLTFSLNAPPKDNTKKRSKASAEPPSSSAEAGDTSGLRVIHFRKDGQTRSNKTAKRKEAPSSSASQEEPSSSSSPPKPQPLDPVVASLAEEIMKHHFNSVLPDFFPTAFRNQPDLHIESFSEGGVIHLTTKVGRKAAKQQQQPHSPELGSASSPSSSSPSSSFSSSTPQSLSPPSSAVALSAPSFPGTLFDDIPPSSYAYAAADLVSLSRAQLMQFRSFLKNEQAALLSARMRQGSSIMELDGAARYLESQKREAEAALSVHILQSPFPESFRFCDAAMVVVPDLSNRASYNTIFVNEPLYDLFAFEESYSERNLDAFKQYTAQGRFVPPEYYSERAASFLSLRYDLGMIALGKSNAKHAGPYKLHYQDFELRPFSINMYAMLILSNNRPFIMIRMVRIE